MLARFVLQKSTYARHREPECVFFSALSDNPGTTHKLRANHSITLLLRGNPTPTENLFPARKCAMQRANRVSHRRFVGRGCGLEAQRYAPSRVRYEIIIWLANGGLRGSSIYGQSLATHPLSRPLLVPLLHFSAADACRGGTRG